MSIHSVFTQPWEGGALVLLSFRQRSQGTRAGHLVGRVARPGFTAGLLAPEPTPAGLC